MKRKLLALVLAMVMVSSLFAGCGKEKKDDAKTNTTSEQNETTGKQTVKVGVMTPLSGAGARTGEYYREAIEVAYKHIVEDGFLENYNLEFEFVDDKRDTAEAVTAANYVIDQYGADVSIGHVWTTMVLASGQFFEDAQVPNIGIVSGPASVAQGWDYTFIATGTDFVLADTLLQYLVKEKGFSKIAVLNVNTEGGMSAAARIEETLKNTYGLDLAAHETHGADDTDFTAQVLRFKEAGADAVVFWGGTQSPANIFMKQIEQLWGPVPEEVFFAGGSNMAQATMLENWTLEDLEGVTFPTGFYADMTNEKIARFVTDFQAIDKEGQAPSDVAARVYDSVYHIATALNNLGVSDVKADDFSVKLRDALAGASFDGVQGHFDYSQFDNGEGLASMNVAAWANDGTYSKIWAPEAK
jgi:branched-chain amino acid transport system substrate-binding protein